MNRVVGVNKWSLKLITHHYECIAGLASWLAALIYSPVPFRYIYGRLLFDDNISIGRSKLDIFQRGKYTTRLLSHRGKTELRAVIESWQKNLKERGVCEGNSLHISTQSIVRKAYICSIVAMLKYLGKYLVETGSDIQITLELHMYC